MIKFCTKSVQNTVRRFENEYYLKIGYLNDL